MSVIAFPTAKTGAILKWTLDEQRLRQWYESLSWDEQDQWFGIYEIRARTGIPLVRLPELLHRCYWVSTLKRGYPGLRLWHGPAGTDPLPDP